jgi:hypothetical protein
MRHIFRIVIALLFIVPSVTYGAEYLEEVESEVYQTNGTIQEISTRAKTCIAQIVRNDEVRISDSVSGTGPLAGLTGGTGGGHSDGVQGGQVLVDADIDAGMITANNRIDYKSMLLTQNVKSTMTVLAKEGRFKIRHTNIEGLQKSTGYMHNTGYSRVRKGWGSGWKDTEKALMGISEKVAACIQTSPNQKDW